MGHTDSRQHRVALISHSNSGISHYAHCLGNALAQTGDWEVHLLTNVAFQGKERPGLNIARVFRRTRWLPLDLISAAAYLHRHRISLLHFQSTVKYPALTCFLIWLARASGRTVVYTAHDVLPHYALPYHRIIMRRLYQQPNAVIAHSQAALKVLKAIAPRVRHAAAIPHGLYDMFIRAEPIDRDKARQLLGIDSTKRLMLFFGRIDERKGAAALIRQLPALVERVPTMHLLMAGRPAYAPGELERMAKELGVGEHLTVVSRWIPDTEVEIYFRAADTIVLPYLEGTTSGVIKIALAAERPVIATRVGDLPEIVEETGCGILVDMPFSTRDIDAIASLLLSEQPTRANLDSAQVRTMSWPAVADRTGQLYAKATTR